MNKSIVLTNDQKDCLQELINISYGSATSAISKIIDRFATLSIPSVEIISSQELSNKLLIHFNNNKKNFITTQIINGELSGQNLFIIDNESAKNLAREFGLEEDELVQNEIEEIILEITNILSGTASSTFASLLEAEISFTPPCLKFVKNTQEIQEDFNTSYEHIIVITTRLEFIEKNIQAELIFMKDKESFLILQKKLEKFINEY